MPILSVKHLNTRIQVGARAHTVVSDISFDLHSGKTLALVGESGCGKTMTALSILRILPTPPALDPQGEVIYQGTNLLQISEKEMRKIRGGKIAMIFQDPTTALNPVYTIGWQMMEAAQLHLNLDEEGAYLKSADALAEVGVHPPKEILAYYPHQLSGGMKQRVLIAMALMCEPDVLIADEPTTALDVTIQAQVLDLIRNLQKQRGMALMLITHDMGVVAEMADDVIVMYASEAVERGDVNSMFDMMAHPYTIGLFNSRPHGKTDRERLAAIKGTVPSITHYPHGCRFHPRCPFMMDKCKKGSVPMFQVSSETAVEHAALCWLHDGTTESREKWNQKKQ